MFPFVNDQDVLTAVGGADAVLGLAVEDAVVGASSAGHLGGERELAGPDGSGERNDLGRADGSGLAAVRGV